MVFYPGSKLSCLGEWGESRESARASGLSSSLARSREAHFPGPDRRARSQANGILSSVTLQPSVATDENKSPPQTKLNLSFSLPVSQSPNLCSEADG